MPTTTNYGWTTPADTDLVKDGAAAIRTLGSSIDSTLKTQIDAQIPDSLLTTTGDIIYASGASTPARLGIGSSSQYLTVSGGVPSWGAVSAGSNWSLLNSGGTALTGAATITVSGISGKDKILILVDGASASSGSGTMGFRLNADTGSNYYTYGGYAQATGTALNIVGRNQGASNLAAIADTAEAASTLAGYISITGCNSSGVKAYLSGGGSSASGVAGNQRGYWSGGYYNSSSTISSVSVFNAGGTNFDAGTVYVYTSA